MVLTLKPYAPISKVCSDRSSIIHLTARILTRYGEVVIDFGEFSDLISYSDALSIEGSASWTLRMAANVCNEELLKKIHPGYVIEVYAARNDNPLLGVIRDPSTIERIDTTPDLGAFEFPPTTQPTLDNVANSAPITPGVLQAGSYGGVSLDAEQVANAEVIASVGRELGASDRDIAIAIGVAMQESSLRNINHGDRDSLGLFQQRPSMDWGSRSEITDPRYATRAFFMGAGTNPGLFDYPERNEMSFTRAAQRVQRSGFPDHYARWEDMSVDMTRRLGGAAPAPTQTPVVQPASETPVAVETQQTARFSTTLAAQRYAAPRDGGNRRHAGVDLDIPNDSTPTAISFIGGVVTRVDKLGNPPSNYGHLVDIWNANLGVVERIAEFSTKIVTQVGATVLPGQAVGRGEGGAGVFHYEIRTSNLEDAGNGTFRGGFRFQGTTDPIAFLTGIGVDPYAEPSKVFQNARFQPPVGGLPTVSSGAAPVSVPAIAVEGAIIAGLEDYYLDSCPHLLLVGVIGSYGRATNDSTVLTISGEGFESVYKQTSILLDQNSPSTLGQALEVRLAAQLPNAVSLIWYQILRNWVESWWGEPTGWEARTREIPLPPNYFARINEGSAWSALQAISIDGIFHTFVDHTGAIVWEKLPWSSRDSALIAGRNWEDLPKLDLPSWKIQNWNDRLTEQGLSNFIRIIPTHAGQAVSSMVGLVYNMGSIRQYRGCLKREIQAPFGVAAEQWYTSAPRREAEATQQTFAALVALECVRWYDRPVQRVNVTVMGESAWRIGTRLELKEDWHCPNAQPGQYYVSSREHNIDVQSGKWSTSLSLVRDRRNRYLGIGVGEVAIISEEMTPATFEAGASIGAISTGRIIASEQFTASEDFNFGTERINLYSPPGPQGEIALANRLDLRIPLPHDEYYFFDLAQTKVIPIGNDPIAYANNSIIPVLGQLDSTEVESPTTDTGLTDPTAGGLPIDPATVQAPQLENNAPPGSYTFALERGGTRITEVPSPINGVVTRSMVMDDYGQVVEVRGSDGRLWFFAHLGSRSVRVGQRVSRGQPLGNQGGSGFTNGEQFLHVEFRRESRGRITRITDRTVTRPLIDEYLSYVQTSNLLSSTSR